MGFSPAAVLGEIKRMGLTFKTQISEKTIYNYIDKLEAAPQENRFIRETTELYYIPLLAAIILSFILALVVRRAK